MKKSNIWINIFERKKKSRYLQDYTKLETDLFREETMEIKSKKMLVNRSEIMELTKTLQLIQNQITTQNAHFSNRLNSIEQNISKIKLKPKQRPKSAQIQVTI